MAEENAPQSQPSPAPDNLAPEVSLPAAPRRSETSGRLDPLIGQRLASYEILSRVARGGMGVVYRARHVYIDKIVAVKVLDPALAQRQDLIDRFRTEAQSLARVEHENVVKVIDILEDKGSHFIVMDFAEGANLRTIVKEQGPLAPADLLSVARQTAEALYAAHREGILHRDIKPENLIRNARGRCKLADFGLAGDLRLIAEGHEGPLNFGTPAYSAPEVLRRMVPDKRSDIFSFGATMYHLAVGEPPFGHSGLSQIMLKQKQGAEMLESRRPDLPPKLCSLIMNCLALDPKDRPESFAEILERLPRRAHARAATPGATPTETADLLATASAPLPPTEPAPEPQSRLVSVGILVLAVSAAALVAVLAWNQLRGSDPPPINEPGANTVAVNAPAPANNAPLNPPANNAPGPTFLPEDEAFAAAELDSRTAMSKSDYPGAWQAFANFLQKYPGSRHADGAKRQQRDVQSRVQQLRDQEYRKAREASDEALKEKRTADAVAAVDRFPPELLRPLFTGEEIEAAGLLETQRQVVIAAEAGDLARVLEQADTLRKAWRDEAEKGEGLSEFRRLRSAPNLMRTRELLEQFLPGRTADAQEKVNKRLSELRRQLETAHQNALLAPNGWRQFCGGLRAEWAQQGVTLWDDITPLMAERKLEDARKQVDALIDRITKARVAAAAGMPRDVAARMTDRREVEDLLRKLRDDIQLAEKCALAINGGLRRLKSEGKAVEVKAHDGLDSEGKRSTRLVRVVGRVTSVTATEVEVDDGGSRTTFRLDMLTQDTVRAVIKPSRSMEEQLSLVAWLVALGRADLAESEEARILRMPELTNAAQARIRELVGGARLAPAAWRRLAYMASIAGKLAVPDVEAPWGATIETEMFMAQQAAISGGARAAAAYIALVAQVADPELVHLETFAQCLTQGLPQVADLRNRLTLEPWDAEAHAALARALKRDGDNEQAKLEAQRALLIDPSHEDAWALLKEIG